MRLLTFNLYLAVFVITFGCTNKYAKNVYPIPVRKLSNQETYFKNTYGVINSRSDTVIIDNQLCRTYNGGILKKIGRIEDNNPIGYWFIFDDSLKVEYILKYDKNKIDSFYHPFAIVQERW